MKRFGRKFVKFTSRWSSVVHTATLLLISYVAFLFLVRDMFFQNIPTPAAVCLLLVVYVIATVAVLLYHSAREKYIYEHQMQEEVRSNSLLNAAITLSSIRFFEVSPEGKIRLLKAGPKQESQTAFTTVTSGQLLQSLNVYTGEERKLQLALHKALMGERTEIEVKTEDPEETWFRITLMPLSGNEETAAIGTIRNVTDEVMRNHRNTARNTLFEHMMADTLTGMEVALEENSWHYLWGSPFYMEILRAYENKLSFSQLIEEKILPRIHPQDQENCRRFLDNRSLIAAFLSGESRVSLAYRVQNEENSDYIWHRMEVYFFRDPATGKVKCSAFVQEIEEAKRRELEETRRLEEREQDMLLQAKRLVGSEDQLGFVQVIRDYYKGIYVVDLHEDQTRRIKTPPYFAKILLEEGNWFRTSLTRYGEEFVAAPYRDALFALLKYDLLLRMLEEKRQIELSYQKSDETWIRLRVLPMPDYSQEHPETIWIFEDETETASLRLEEEKAKLDARAAEAANQAKSRFLANVSHDIRTPLNAILGFSELGLREESVQEKNSCFRDIRSSGRHLLDNINSVLDLTKIEAGKLELVPENYHIFDCIHQAASVLKVRAEEKELAFHLEVDENIPVTLYGDDLAICNILINLGSNAVKYTEKGSVTLRFQWEPKGEHGFLLFTVEDTGVGIREEDIPHIFQDYSRLLNEQTSRVEGTGLGLAICRELTSMMQGELNVESVYGKGSTFRVRLPQTVVDAAPCGVYSVENQEEIQVFQHQFTAPEAVVLLVDDQAMNRKVCEGLLRPYAMQVFTAASGREALEQVTQVWPDLVLMDHMMPDMDGVEATEKLREWGKKDPYFALLPVIALTANAMKGDQERYLQHGFHDFLSKPIDLEKLDAILREWIPEDKQIPVDADAVPLSSSAPLSESLATLPGIDTRQGLALCGTEELYRQTLTMFRQQIPERTAAIRQKLEEKALQEYRIEVHSLKSAARWIGALSLGDKAETLEKAAKENDWETISCLTPSLLTDYRAMQDILAEI